MRAIEATRPCGNNPAGTDGIEHELRGLLDQRRRSVSELRKQLDCDEVVLRGLLAKLSEAGEIAISQRWSEVLVTLDGGRK